MGREPPQFCPYCGTVLSPVDPANLILFEARTFAKFGTFQKTYICSAVDASALSGTPQADHEVAAAQFSHQEEFANSEGQLLTSWPNTYRDLWW